MRTVRRLLSWTLFLGCLTALGVGVFVFVRQRPRCTIKGSLAQMHLSSDGSRLLTLTEPKGNALHGPATCTLLFHLTVVC